MVYILEDDESILELILYALNTQSIDAQGFKKPSDFWTALNEQKPLAIVLDVMLPQEDGISILKRLRHNMQTKDIPIMVLTALGSELDKVKGLDSGADDYLSKPFGVMELLARIRVLLRRVKRKVDGDIVIADLNISYSKRTVLLHSVPIVLTLKEFELLYFFANNLDRAFTREELLNELWNYSLSSAETRTVDMHINTLRQKLGDWGKRIKTVRGVGYKLVDKI